MHWRRTWLRDFWNCSQLWKVKWLSIFALHTIFVEKKPKQPNVFVVNMQFLLSSPSFTSLFPQLTLLEQCAFTYFFGTFYCCILESGTTRICTKICCDESKCSNLVDCQHQHKRKQKCRTVLFCALNVITSLFWNQFTVRWGLLKIANIK